MFLNGYLLSAAFFFTDLYVRRHSARLPGCQQRYSLLPCLNNGISMKLSYPFSLGSLIRASISPSCNASAQTTSTCSSFRNSTSSARHSTFLIGIKDFFVLSPIFKNRRLLPFVCVCLFGWKAGKEEKFGRQWKLTRRSSSGASSQQRATSLGQFHIQRCKSIVLASQHMLGSVVSTCAQRPRSSPTSNTAIVNGRLPRFSYISNNTSYLDRSMKFVLHRVTGW